MLHAIATATGQVELLDTPLPALAPGELLVKMRLCGVCGTDVMKVYTEGVPKPVALGHEVVAEIVEKGAPIENEEKVSSGNAADTFDSFSVGDRVVLLHHVPDATSHFSQRGSETMDAHFKQSNIVPGGFAEYIRLSSAHIQEATLLVPDEMPDERAVFVEPLTCVLRSLARVQISSVAISGSLALIVGVGAIGALFVPLLRAQGIAVFATDMREERLVLVKQWGASHSALATEADLDLRVRQASNGRGADLVVLSVLNQATFALAMNAVRDGGTILLFGAKPETELQTDWWQIWRREINIVSSYGSQPALMPQALDLLQRLDTPFQETISHTLPLAQTAEAIALVHDGQASKVIVAGI